MCTSLFNQASGFTYSDEFKCKLSVVKSLSQERREEKRKKRKRNKDAQPAYIY